MAKNPDKVKQGKKNRAAGGAFELRVRKDLEEDGWIVDKFTNNVDMTTNLNPDRNGTTDMGDGVYASTLAYYPPKYGKLIPAKRKYAGFGRPMVIGTGFPDFVTFRNISYGDEGDKVSSLYEVVGVECKCNGNLDRIEKEKCRWLLKKNIFSKILIAEKTKVKNKIVIVYHDFEVKYGNS